MDSKELWSRLFVAHIQDAMIAASVIFVAWAWKEYGMETARGVMVALCGTLFPVLTVSRRDLVKGKRWGELSEDDKNGFVGAFFAFFGAFGAVMILLREITKATLQ